MDLRRLFHDVTRRPGPSMVERIGKAGAPASRELSSDEQERDSIAFTLDGRQVRVRRDETIWHAARRHGVTIPHGCLSSAPDFRPEGNCRLCVVEVEGYRTLQPSCLMKVSEGLVIRTDSERAVHARRTRHGAAPGRCRDRASVRVRPCGIDDGTYGKPLPVLGYASVRATRVTSASPWTSRNASIACGACKRAARSRSTT